MKTLICFLSCLALVLVFSTNSDAGDFGYGVGSGYGNVHNVYHADNRGVHLHKRVFYNSASYPRRATTVRYAPGYFQQSHFPQSNYYRNSFGGRAFYRSSVYGLGYGTGFRGSYGHGVGCR